MREWVGGWGVREWVGGWGMRLGWMVVRGIIERRGIGVVDLNTGEASELEGFVRELEA